MLSWGHQDEPGSIPGGLAPGFSHAGIVPYDPAGRRVFSPSPPSRSCIPALPHTQLASSSSALKNPKSLHFNLHTLLFERGSVKRRWGGPYVGEGVPYNFSPRRDAVRRQHRRPCEVRWPATHDSTCLSPAMRRHGWSSVPRTVVTDFRELTTEFLIHIGFLKCIIVTNKTGFIVGEFGTGKIPTARCAVFQKDWGRSMLGSCAEDEQAVYLIFSLYINDGIGGSADTHEKCTRATAVQYVWTPMVKEGIWGGGGERREAPIPCLRRHASSPAALIMQMPRAEFLSPPKCGLLVTYHQVPNPNDRGAAVAELLACSPPTKANRAQSLAGSLPNFR
ncbi:hypothetical protein PR048_014636 [Dryococelus australis]|uniref:Uncharacterized protein n=1 Tax=Dryococelus australis TaxID=614101 RepID=A0ABQ9HES6_9NEOP|nr:hypothetical protein PR048_014636 [Dryococelus australis]